MPDLLIEFLSEEIPARMQKQAAESLKKMVTDRLVEAGLPYEGARAFATPRRLALSVQGVPARQPDLKEEKKGPRVGAPDGAIQGFLKSAGLASIDQATISKDPKKGDFYLAVIEKAGRPAIEVVGEIVPQVIRAFPWPKSMRWGAGDLTWVRPLQSIVATFGPETEEPEVIPFSIDGLTSGDTTRGHRFLAPDAIRVKRLDDYTSKLEAGRVVLDPQRRKDIILGEAKTHAFVQGLELVEDEALLEEVAGLVEWPVVLMGTFDEAFLAIPPEVIRTTIRANQKCFVLRDPNTKKLANKFVLVSNIEATDGGKMIVAGNERVIRARLSDAKFFYETDLKTKLEDRLPKFEQIVFHEKLGTQGQRIERIERLAGEIAPLVGADVEKAKRAARLAKADLLTEVVGEFPELQGLMGKYYALAQGEDPSIAQTSEDHYKPAGPADRVPTDPVAVAVALADKIDTLVGFWAIVEKPTGSKDPYALRRAALGIIRIVEKGFRLKLETIFLSALRQFFEFTTVMQPAGNQIKIAATVAGHEIHHRMFGVSREQGEVEVELALEVYRDNLEKQTSADLLSFIVERLKVQLREQGARHDLVDAVLAAEQQDDLLMIVQRAEALAKFLDTEDGKNLLAGTKRAANILRIEEKKDGVAYTDEPDKRLYQVPEEQSLATSLLMVMSEVKPALAKDDFAGAMAAMARLRPKVDAFFDKVTVNVEDPPLRENRLKLLNQIRAATAAVADFSKIEG